MSHTNKAVSKIENISVANVFQRAAFYDIYKFKLLSYSQMISLITYVVTCGMEHEVGGGGLVPTATSIEHILAQSSLAVVYQINLVF